VGVVARLGYPTAVGQEEAVPYSLNKGKRWEQVEELKQQLAHSHDSDDDNDDPGDQHPADTPTSIKEVMEVQVHQRDVIGSLSWRVRAERALVSSPCRRIMQCSLIHALIGSGR